MRRNQSRSKRSWIRPNSNQWNLYPSSLTRVSQPIIVALDNRVNLVMKTQFFKTQEMENLYQELTINPCFSMQMNCQLTQATWQPKIQGQNQSRRLISNSKIKNPFLETMISNNRGGQLQPQKEVSNSKPYRMVFTRISWLKLVSQLFLHPSIQPRVSPSQCYLTAYGHHRMCKILHQHKGLNFSSTKD